MTILKKYFLFAKQVFVCSLLITQFQDISGDKNSQDDVSQPNMNKTSIKKVPNDKAVDAPSNLVTASKKYSFVTSPGSLVRDATTAAALLQDGKFKDAAEKYRVSFLASRQERHDTLSRASRIAHTAFVNFMDGKFAEASTLFQDAFEAMSEPSSYQIIYASSAVAATLFAHCRDAALLAVKATVLLRQGNFHPAIESFKLAKNKINDSMRDMNEVLDNCISATTIASIGKPVLMDGNFKEAAEIFQRAYEKAKVDEISVILLNLKTQSGLAWKGFLSIKHLRCFLNASKSFQEAYEVSNIPAFYYTFGKFRDASNLAKQGSIFLQQGQFTSALVEFKNALDKTDREVFMSYINATKSAITGYDLLKEGKAFEASEQFQNALLMRDYIFPDDAAVFVNCRDTLLLAAEGQAVMKKRKMHEAFIKFREAFNLSKVREVQYLLARLKKLPYESGSYISHCEIHEDFGTHEFI